MKDRKVLRELEDGPKKTNNDKILSLLKEKINEGAIKYGEQVPIDGSRDNLKEAIDELLDLCIYLSAVALELHEKYRNAE